MRQVTIENLKKHLSKEIIDLPLEVTKRGKTIAYIVRTLDRTEEAKDAKDAILKLEQFIRGKDAPMFCPKHNRMRAGDNYMCGCKVS